MSNLKQIQYFAGVAEYGSIRKAAEKLGVTQPTISTQLNALEEKLGVTLLERSRSKTTLTPQGRELLHPARNLISQWRDLEELAHSLSDSAAITHRLGVPPTLGPYLLPRITPALHSTFPRLKLYVREESQADLEAGLLEGRHDLILATLPLANENLGMEVLCREPMSLVAPTEMDIGSEGVIDESDLAGVEVLGLDDRHHVQQQVKRICQRTGARLNRDYEGTSLDTLRQMISMNMGVAFLPALYIHSEIHRPEELKVIRFSGNVLYCDHALVYRPGSAERHLYRGIATVIRKALVENFQGAVTVIDRR
ncbi:hydrogen peroxide-inducible genes activator [Microbulbifer sp. TYP-18]|uniref:hydrogen peroxide-inducible genes activator n=1 Tax=Microbulbifer sp. TYP-18 TaxID=3230024 RepID=UPI0034C6422B